MSSTEHLTTPSGRGLPPGTRVKMPGPLGPWRLSAAVVAVVVTTGPQLVRATSTGHQLDQALGRALAVAVVTWVLLGVINRILAHTTVVGEESSLVTTDDDGDHPGGPPSGVDHPGVDPSGGAHDPPASP